MPCCWRGVLRKWVVERRLGVQARNSIGRSSNRSECMQAWESMYAGERWSRAEGPKWSERSANRCVECLSVAKPDLLTDLDVSGGCEQGSDVSVCATRTAEMLRRAMAGARVARRRAGCGGGDGGERVVVVVER